MLQHIVRYFRWPTRPLTLEQILSEWEKCRWRKVWIKRVGMAGVICSPFLIGMIGWISAIMRNDAATVMNLIFITFFPLLAILFAFGLHAWWQAYRFCMAYGEPVFGIFMLNSSGFAGAPTVKVDMRPWGRTLEEALEFNETRKGKLDNFRYYFADSRLPSTNLAWLDPKTISDDTLLMEGRMIRDPKNREILVIEPFYETSYSTLVLYWILYLIMPICVALVSLVSMVFGVENPISWLA